MIQYNILSYMKWFESYETMRGLFMELTGKIAELSVAPRMRRADRRSLQLNRMILLL